ncbi:MAG: prepilin-type N-terminal cleavage/methylation domain-containing protein [Chthoniobacterales bacterium]|nr:prepilin-type N-terminal cleavage/methylation domain-containing protein [Chthoniobacterales bacterium]
MRSDDHIKISDLGKPLNHEGFTLMEVLVSSAILVVLILLLLGMGDGASKVWRDGEGRREALRELRASLQIITEDLHSAVITTNSDSLDIRKSEQERSPGLFFLVSHPADRRHSEIKGDLCDVGYFLAADPKEQGCTNLYRFHASGEPVSKAVEEDSLQDLYEKASPENAATTELLARNIVFFQIRSLPEQSTPPELLKVTLSAINTRTARLIASEPKAGERNSRLLREGLQRSTAIIHLPPYREGVSLP